MATKGRFSGKKMCVKNLFQNFICLCIGNFVYIPGYNTKVICTRALKLFRRENKSIKMNPTDFSTWPEIKDVCQGALFNKKIFFTPPPQKKRKMLINMINELRNFSGKSKQFVTQSEIQENHRFYYKQKQYQEFTYSKYVMTSLC